MGLGTGEGCPNCVDKAIAERVGFERGIALAYEKILAYADALENNAGCSHFAVYAARESAHRVKGLLVVSLP